ncbi:MAG: hypothetical protein L6R42_000114 [Xanthoria sp. 1 TBL-2021]|nr:MAG: hypothetical protein L6R42_000114 [Xanthoria sp. 1 TBL-2021]
MMLSKSHQLVFALLLCTSRVAAIGTIPQIILNEPNPCPNPPSGNQCGFWYPGLYRIINYGFQYAATMNDSTPGAAVVSMPWNDTDLAQQWGIMYTDASENVTMIFNRATGTALSAVQST